MVLLSLSNEALQTRRGMFWMEGSSLANQLSPGCFERCHHQADRMTGFGGIGCEGWRVAGMVGPLGPGKHTAL
eukprot:2819401-Karenia_brevis.AAC.1